ncbi:MAG: hypothetical protein EOO86_14080 [Pedobacter sp.]|nr:MAG: hypothetical protein EOO86_14080 [Pedobacter sp.]
MIVNDQLPTSTLLEIKIGDHIERDTISGQVSKIDIQETDEYLQFLFNMDSDKQIVIRKLKQVC